MYVKLIVAFLFIPALMFCQIDSAKAKRKIGFYSGMNLVYSNFSELNTIISQIGYPKLQEFSAGPAYGVTLNKRKKNDSYSHVAISFLSSAPTIAGTSRYAHFKGGEIQIGRAFDLIKSPKWLVYPYFIEGVGYGVLSLFDNVAVQSFAASAANLAIPNKKTWSSFYVYLGVGGGFERRIRIRPFDFYVGASGGYRLNYSRFTEDYPLGNKAPINLSGFEWNVRIRFDF